MQYVDEDVYEYDNNEDLPGAGYGSGLGGGCHDAEYEMTPGTRPPVGATTLTVRWMP